jgi:hypothetical protein
MAQIPWMDGSDPGFVSHRVPLSACKGSGTGQETMSGTSCCCLLVAYLNVLAALTKLGNDNRAAGPHKLKHQERGMAS